MGITISKANVVEMPVIGTTRCKIDDAICTTTGKLVDGNDSYPITSVAVQIIIASRQPYTHRPRQGTEAHSWAKVTTKLQP
jgi:hypothetical protein